MKNYKVYTDLDSCMDPRYGLLTKLLTAKGADFETTFAANYKDRVVDYFERPNLGITFSDYEKAFEERSVDDLPYYKPSKLLRSLLSILVDMEQISGKLITIEGIELTLNVWPYVLDDALTDYLKNELSKIHGVLSVELIFVPFNTIKSSTLKAYTHALSYYLMLGKEYSSFQTTIGNPHTPDLKIGVPAINKHDSTDEITQVMSPESIYLISGILLANSIILVPISPNVFDYEP